MRQFSGLFLAGCLAASFAINSYAEVVLSSPSHNLIPVRIESPLNSVSMPQGAEIKVVLTEDVVMKGQRLPAFSVFSGTVEKVHHGERLGHYGYVKMGFNQLCFPTRDVPTPEKPESSDCLKLDSPHHIKVNSIYPYRPDKSFKSIVAHQMPIQLASTAVAIPLTYATHLGFLSGWLIEHGVGAATGTVQEVLDPKDKHSAVYKAGYGVLRSTSLPFWYEMGSKSPDFDFPAGMNLSFHFDPDFLSEVFEKIKPDMTIDKDSAGFDLRMPAGYEPPVTFEAEE